LYWSRSDNQRCKITASWALEDLLANSSVLGYPLVGSVPDVPEKNGFVKFADWGKEYGPIYQVNLAGHNHVWVSTDQIAKDLLSKKAAIYSDRPHIPALIDDNRTSAQYLPLLSRNGEYSFTILNTSFDTDDLRWAYTTAQVCQHHHARV
jgi:hypothetical protein